MTIEESRQYIERFMQWHIHEETFEVIEEETCLWVAEVTITHLQEQENVSLFVIVQGCSSFIIHKRWRHKLGEWFRKYL